MMHESTKIAMIWEKNKQQQKEKHANTPLLTSFKYYFSWAAMLITQ